MEFQCALNIDIEEGDLFLVLDLLDLSFCSSIQVGVDFAMLNEFIGCDHLLKLLFSDEVVSNAVFFALSRLARGVRNAESEFIRVSLRNRI